MWILLDCSHLLIKCIAPLCSSQMMHWSSYISLSIWKKLHKTLWSINISNLLSKEIKLKVYVYTWCEYHHFKKLAMQCKIVLISSTSIYFEYFQDALIALTVKLVAAFALSNIKTNSPWICKLFLPCQKRGKNNYIVLCKEREEVVGDWAWFIDEPQTGRGLPLSSGPSFSWKLMWKLKRER